MAGRVASPFLVAPQSEIEGVAGCRAEVLACRSAIILQGVAVQKPLCDSKTVHRVLNGSDVSRRERVALTQGAASLAD